MYIILYLLAAGVAFFVFGALFSTKLRVRKIQIKNDKSKTLKGFKIVLLSDLHGRSIGKDQNMLADEILKQKPDLVVMAGDMIDAYSKDAKAAGKLAEKLHKKVEVIAVRGNHFYKNKQAVRDEMESFFNDFGVTTLKNERKCFTYKDNKICIDGIDDPIAQVGYKGISKKDQIKRNRAAMQITLEKMQDENAHSDYRILLCHRPTDVDLFERADYDLALTDHTHGGQWALPFGIEILGDEAKFFPPQNMQSGLHYHKKMPLIITSGIGYSNVKLRTFMPPEIVVITFE